MSDKGARLILGEIPLSEEDVKIRFITPALERAGWFKERMRTEVSLTDGRVLLSGNKPGHGAKKRADYLLWHHPNANPIAVVEAKGADALPSFGLQQAIGYAKLCGASFAYASNGQAFEEYDLLTGQERELPMEAFPSPEALHKRFLAHGDGGNPLSAAEAGLLCEPYYVSATKPKTPRCYQRCAVTNALKAIAKGERRILLVLATGTGKTFIAFQIVWRLLQRGLCHRVLFLADRNILVDQAQANDFAPLANVCHKIDFNKDLNNRVGNSAYQVYFGLYHQFYGDRDEPEEEEAGVDKPMRAALLFPPDFFDLVIVDECHRGSARDNSRWRKILDYFSSARQLGMTATPRETEDASNSAYFGTPVYSYSLAQGIDDGFLAPFYVRRIKTNIGEGWRPAAVVLPDGFLFGNDAVKRALKQRLLDDFNLHTVVRLPPGVFAPYTPITTNILFFDRSGPTHETWFYRPPLPQDGKPFSKTRPMPPDFFAPVEVWWDNRDPIQRDGIDLARAYTPDELRARDLNLDLCGPAAKEEEILPIHEALARYQAKRAQIDARIATLTAKLQDLLPR